MPALTSALLKHQIEAQLAHRIPAALSPMARLGIERQPLHDPRLTELLGGGIPVGGISEIHGEACSGRTSVALSLAAAVTAAERVVAWVDASDELDPETAALCGVDLERLLWVRCGKPATHAEVEPGPIRRISAHSAGGASAYGAVKSGAVESGAAKPGAVTAVQPNLVAAGHAAKPVGNGGCGSPHPLSEGRGMAAAIDALLQQQPRSAAIPDRRAKKHIGTPGMPNRDVLSVLQPQSVSHHVAMVLGKAARFPDGLPKQPGSRLVRPEEIVPTGGNLFGREVERKHTFGTDRSAQPTCFRPQRPALPFPEASPYREEQIPTDRQPSRRAQAAAQPTATTETPRATPRGLDRPLVARRTSTSKDDWALLDGTPLDQALRSVDLLLQAGGFSLLVLDLSSVPADKAWRIPLATWFRFRAGCERSRCSLVVLSQQPCARASADLTVALRRTALHTEGARVITGASTALELEQQRRGTGPASRHGDHFALQSNVVPFRKPVRSDHLRHAAEPAWKAGTHWSVRA